MTVLPGSRLGPFEIVSAIGSGGMGEVYKARDTKLGREVAIKVLPAEISSDAEGRARFEQEARSASALNHPNIITIHDIGTSDGALYIAMEFVDGRTLRELLLSGPLGIKRLVSIAAQVADGLSKAHAAGIVHRDLKPENVMVNKDGFVKILDFGLAKLVAPVSDKGSQLQTLAGPGTRPGVVMGTVGYMSPEQASGQIVDFRSDQFSLGAILYEMATGKRAFQKKTAVETLSAIIREEPEPIAGVNPTAPAPLRWIVERCLAKEPEDRYASTRDLARDLKQTLEHLSEASGEAAAVEKPKMRRPLWLAVALLALLAVGVLDIALRLRSGAAPAAKATATLKRVTFAPGLEDEPSFSPDGKFLAYATDERGNLDVVVQPLSGGEVIRVASTDADEAQPAWSPDGSRIAFVSARDHGGRLGVALNVAPLEPYLNSKLGDIFIVPALGGTPVKLVEDAYYPAWSRDGKRVVFMADRKGQFDLWTVPAEGGTPTRLTKDPDFDYQPAWSPDGKWVAYGSGPLGAAGFNVRVVAASGEAPIALTKDFGYVTRPAWSADGKSIFFSGERNGILNAWQIPFAGEPRPAEPSRLTLGQGQDANISASRDGKKLAFAAVRNEFNIWELTVGTGQLRPVTSGAGNPDYPQPSPDGKTLLVQSNRSGQNAVWTVDLTGKFLSELTPGQGNQPVARWSPDGRRIAYLQEQKLKMQSVGSMSAEDTGIEADHLDWSPDGLRIAFSSPTEEKISPGEIGMYSVPDGKTRFLTSFKKRAANPAWSPDGKWIAFYTQRGSIREIWIVSSEGGTPRQLTVDSEDSHPAWSPRNPDEILFLRDHKRLAILSVSTGKVRFLPGYAEGSYILDYPSWSPDAKRVYFSVSRKTGDIYILEGF
ncbi:MAG: protein kinase domain-containing protein [Thermoanaerobaculia bacterium]